MKIIASIIISLLLVLLLPGSITTGSDEFQENQIIPPPAGLRDDRGLNESPGQYTALIAGPPLEYDEPSELAAVPMNPSYQTTSDAVSSVGQPEITEILAAHNNYRNEVGSPPLIWSSTLAVTAQNWADQIAATGNFVHSGGSGYGENLAAGSPPGSYSWTNMVNLWGSEKQYFIYAPFGDGSSTTGHWYDVGHYTQVIWYNTQQCGCGKATGYAGGYSWDYFVCQYSPPGNYLGQYPYPLLVKENLGVFRNGFWILDKNGNFQWDGTPGDIVAGFGTTGDVPVVADWNDDSRDNIGLFRNGFWILDKNGNFQWDDVGTGNDLVAGFGAAGDIPVFKDWDNDGSPEIAVFRASAGQWIIDYNGNFQWDGTGTGQDVVVNLGQSGDIPVAGDWDSTGSDKVGIFRNGFWILDKNGNFQWDGTPGDIVAGFGTTGDVPVVADWNDDSRDNIGLFRNGFWILDYNGNFQWNDVGTGNDLVAGFGATGDIPVVRDWNGDGFPEIAVFRASGGQWIIDYNGNFQWDGTGAGQDVIAYLGQSGDKAVAGFW